MDQTTSTVTCCIGYGDSSKPKIAFIDLNPSVADECQDDNTVRKCINIARRDGYGSMVILNAYAYRSTDPKALTT